MFERSLPFAALGGITGVLWLANGAVAFGRPTYWSPTSALDYSAVVLFSAALLALGVCLERFDGGRKDVVSRAAHVAALSAVVVSGANLAEDGLGIRPFGFLFVAGVLVLSVAMLALGAGLALTPGRRALAVPIVLTLLGLFLVNSPYGGFLIAITWIAMVAFNAARVPPFVLLARSELRQPAP